MKRQPKRSRRRREEMQLWIYTQAQAACPYIRAVVTSLRDQVLEMQASQRNLEQLNNRPGRPDRATLIEMQEAQHEVQRIETQIEQTTEELDAINIFALNPLQGQVLLPFVHEDQLAWYIFDLFDPKPLRFWRFQEDSLETRRPIASLPSSASGTTSRP
jgi:Uncharacterized conserved protein (DUF2203)